MVRSSCTKCISLDFVKQEPPRLVPSLLSSVFVGARGIKGREKGKDPLRAFFSRETTGNESGNPRPMITVLHHWKCFLLRPHFRFSKNNFSGIQSDMLSLSLSRWKNYLNYVYLATFEILISFEHCTTLLIIYYHIAIFFNSNR